ncbi:MAG: hypothetical protein GY772_05510 [bacterium]|nr:hypothetical protein [bacterium]
MQYLRDGDVFFGNKAPKEVSAPPTTTSLGTALRGTARVRCSAVSQARVARRFSTSTLVVGSEFSFRVKCLGMW